MTTPHGRRHQADQLIDRIPRDRGDLFRGVVAWAEDVGGWRRSSHETLPEAAGRTLRRTVWDDPRDAQARVAIDVTECASGREAIAALMDRLDWNQLADIPPGPSGLGIVSFRHPDGVPPAVFFARDNLCISVVSFAPRAVSVETMAVALDRRLSREPTPGGPAVGIAHGQPDRGVIPIRIDIPFRLAQEGYLRYRATGGSLEIRDDRVVAIPAGGPLRIEVQAIEPGRPAGTGSVMVPR